MKVVLPLYLFILLLSHEDVLNSKTSYNDPKMTLYERTSFRVFYLGLKKTLKTTPKLPSVNHMQTATILLLDSVTPKILTISLPLFCFNPRIDPQSPSGEDKTNWLVVNLPFCGHFHLL